MNDFSGKLGMKADEHTLDEIALSADLSNDIDPIVLDPDLVSLPSAAMIYDEILSPQWGDGNGQHLCRDRNLKRVVRIRTLTETESSDSEESTVREVQIKAQLNHSSIIPVYGVYRDSDGKILAAEKSVHGKSLPNYIHKLISIFGMLPRSRRLSAGARHLRCRVTMLLRIADAIKYAHTRNITHCKLTANDILLESHGEVFVCNWRNARNGEDVASDCYFEDIRALGRIMKETIFLQTGLPEKQASSTPSPTTDRLGVSVDIELRAIIDMARHSGPNNGYRSVQDLIVDLEHWLNREETFAHPDSRYEHCIRNFLHHRKFIISCFLGLLSALLLSVVFYLALVLEAKQLEIQRDESLLAIHANGFSVSVEFERKISSFAELAFGLQKQVEALQKSIPREDMLKQKFFNEIDGQKTATAPAGYLFCTTYDQKIDFDNFIYKLSPDSPVPELPAQLARMYQLLPTFRQIIFSGMSDGSFVTLPLTEKINVIRTQEKPMVGFVYVSFCNGLHICYPYHSDYQPDYDPRKRNWYKETVAAAGSNVHWTAPYVDNGSLGELVITCSKKIFDDEGNLLGCLGMDITMTRIIQELMQSGNSGRHIQAKLLIDSSGRVLSDSSGGYRCRRKGDSVEFPQFTDADLLKQMLASDNGQVIRRHPDGNVLYFFIRIRALDWIYIEKIDYDGMLKK